MALSGTEGGLAIDVARLFVALVALGIASMTDLRTRRVPNVIWYVAAAVGIGLLAFDLSRLEGGGAWTLALAFPVAAFFAVVVTGGELWPVMPEDEEDPDRELTPSEARVYVADLGVSTTLLVLAVAVMVLAAGRLEDRAALWHVSGSVALILLALAFYVLRLLHGGGDAKALMTLAVLFPAVPALDPFPLIGLPGEAGLVFPFALVVLVDAALITLLAPLAFVTISARRGPLRFPEAFFGYPVPIGEVDDSRMWLLYELEEGAEEPKRRLWPRRSAKAIEARERALRTLRERGDERVYASPKIPFMVPMLAGLIVAVVVGNIVLGLVWYFAAL